MSFKLIVGAAIMSTLVGCAGLLPGTVDEGVRVSRVIDKGAWDLQCKKENIKVIKINDTTYGASGCGKRASYLMDNCMSGIMAANWASVCAAVLNSEIISDKK